MSLNTELHPQYETAPWWAGRKPARSTLAALALSMMPLAAQAGGITYGHAEVTVGFPNGHVTVGKTWETGPRVVQVTHELPEEDCDQLEEEKTVIIEKRVERPKKVVIIEREEPEVVIIEKRVAPQKVVVIHEAPRPVRHVVVHEHRRPREVVVVESPRHHRHVTVVHEGGHGHRGYHHGSHKGGHGHHGGRGNDRYESRPRELFESRPSHHSNQRPSRERGVQHIRVDR